MRPLIVDLEDAGDGLRPLFNLRRAPIARIPIVNLGDASNELPRIFNLLETWIGARADADQLFFSEMRSKVARMPLLDAGLQLGEVIAKQQSDLAYLLVDLVDRALASRDGAGAHRPRPRPASVGDRAVAPRGGAEAHGARPVYTGERTTGDYAQTADLRSDAAQRGPALRLTIPQGMRAGTVLLHLRNHRESVDRVSLSVVAPNSPGVAAIPSQFIRFDPETLDIPALSERSVQLLLRLGPGLEQPGEYWSEIVINGAEAKRVPLALQIRPPAQSDGI